MSFLLLLKTYWRPILLALAAVLCFYAGWHSRGIVYQAEQATELRQAAEQRRKQEEEVQRQDATNETQATALMQATGEKTRKAYQHATDPDRTTLLPASVLRDIDAAAD